MKQGLIGIMLALPPIIGIAAQNFQAQGSSAGLTESEARMFSAGASYENFMGRWSRRLAPAYLAFAGVRDGDRVLDVGTGTGSLASVLEADTTLSEITGIDPSEGFIADARRNARTARTRFEVGDAQALRFDRASFDQTMALLVMNFIPDPVKAIGEMRRVTRPGGVVSACVWDYDAGMQMLRFFWDEVVAGDPAMAPRDERNMKLSHAGELGRLWADAGLVDVREEALTIEQRFDSFADYWGAFERGAGPGGAHVVSLTGEQRRQLESRLRRRLLPERGDGPFVLQASAWCVRGRAPGTQ